MEFLETDFLIELDDQFIDLGSLFLDTGEVIPVIPHLQDLFIGFSLLLDPGEILQVVNAAAVFVTEFKQVIRGLPVQVAGEICSSILLGCIRHTRYAFPSGGSGRVPSSRSARSA